MRQNLHRRIVLFALLVLLAVPALASIHLARAAGGGTLAVVTTNNTSGTGLSDVVANPFPQADNIQNSQYLITVTLHGTSNHVSTIADSCAGDTYHSAVTTAAYDDTEVWYTTYTCASGASNTVTITFSASSTYSVTMALAQGLYTSSVTTGTGSGTCSSGSCTTPLLMVTALSSPIAPAIGSMCISTVSASSTGTTGTETLAVPSTWGGFGVSAEANTFQLSTATSEEWSATYGQTTAGQVISTAGTTSWSYDEAVACFGNSANPSSGGSRNYNYAASAYSSSAVSSFPLAYNLGTPKDGYGLLIGIELVGTATTVSSMYDGGDVCNLVTSSNVYDDTELWYCQRGSGSVGSVIVTLSGSAKYAAYGIEASGFGPYSSLTIQAAKGSGTGCTTPCSTSVSSSLTPNTGSYCLAITSQTSTSTTAWSTTASSPFFQIGSESPSSPTFGVVEYDWPIWTGSSTTAGMTLTLTHSTASSWDEVLGCFSRLYTPSAYSLPSGGGGISASASAGSSSSAVSSFNLALNTASVIRDDWAVLTVSTPSSATMVSSVTDTQSDACSRVGRANTYQNVEMWVCQFSATAADTLTVTFSASTKYDAEVRYASGLSTAIVQTFTGSGTCTSSCTTPTTSTSSEASSIAQGSYCLSTVSMTSAGTTAVSTTAGGTLMAAGGSADYAVTFYQYGTDALTSWNGAYVQTNFPTAWTLTGATSYSYDQLVACFGASLGMNPFTSSTSSASLTSVNELTVTSPLSIGYRGSWGILEIELTGTGTTISSVSDAGDSWTKLAQSKVYNDIEMWYGQYGAGINNLYIYFSGTYTGSYNSEVLMTNGLAVGATQSSTGSGSCSSSCSTSVTASVSSFTPSAGMACFAYEGTSSTGTTGTTNPSAPSPYAFPPLASITVTTGSATFRTFQFVRNIWYSGFGSTTATNTFTLTGATAWNWDMAVGCIPTGSVSVSTISIVQQTSCTVSGLTAGTCAFASNVANGDEVVVGVTDSGTTTSVSSVTDSATDQYDKIIAQAPGTGASYASGDSELWYNPYNSGGPVTVTVNFASSVNAVIVLYELSGASFSIPDSSGGFSSSSSSPTVSSYTPVSGSLVIGVLSSTCVSTCTISAGTSYTLDSSAAMGSSLSGSSEHIFNSGTAETTPFSLSSAQANSEVSAALLPAGTFENWVTQQISICLQESGATAGVFSFSGAQVYPQTGSSSSTCTTTSVTADASSSVTVQVPADVTGGYTRYRLTSSSLTTSVSTCSSAGTCPSTDTVNAYYELQNTYQATPKAQTTWDSGLTPPAVTGTVAGSPLTTGCSITLTGGSGAASCAGWFDYGTPVTIGSSTISGASSNTQWLRSGTCTFTQTSHSSSPNNCNYYKQLLNTYEATPNAQTNWDSGLTSQNVFGTSLGSTGQIICTITLAGAGPQYCTGYADYNSAAVIGSVWTEATDYGASSGSSGTGGVIIERESCATYGGYIYCVGGDSGSSALSDVFYASVSSSGVGAWSETTDYGASSGSSGTGGLDLWTSSCAASGGYIYCVGGTTSASGPGVSKVFYAPVSSSGVGAWSETTDYGALSGSSGTGGIDVYQESCSIFNGYIYCVGGYSTSSALSDVFYAPISSSGVGAWLETTDYGASSGSSGNGGIVVYFHSCSIFNGYIYCVGGYSTSSALSKVFYASVSSSGVGAWSETTDYGASSGSSGTGGVVVYQQSCAASNGYDYCLGGITTGSVYLSKVFYAPLSTSGVGAWKETTDYGASSGSSGSGGQNVARGSCAAGNSYLYCVGGFFSGSPLSKVFYVALTSSGVGATIGGVAANSQWLRSGACSFVGPPYNCNYYKQLQNTYEASPQAQTNWDSGLLSQNVVGTLLGVQGQTICTITFVSGGGVQSCTGYSDVGTAAGIGPPILNAGWTETTDYGAVSGSSGTGDDNVWGTSCVTYDGYIYCVGGRPSTTEISDVFYAPVSSSGVGAWTETTDYGAQSGSSGTGGIALAFTSCQIYSGYIYCVGGFTASGYLSDVFYAPVSSSGVGAWTETTDYGAQSGSSGTGGLDVGKISCQIFGGYIYCVGGYDGSTGTSLSDVFYAPVSSSGVGAWTETTDYGAQSGSSGTGGIPDQYPSCAAYGGYDYCVGGVGSVYLSDVFYAPVSSSGVGAWTETTDYGATSGTSGTGGVDLSGISCNAYNGYIYCVGGRNTAPAFYSDVFYTSLSTSGVGPWAEITDYGASSGWLGQGGLTIYGTSCTTYGGYIYCVAGWYSGLSTSKVFYAYVNSYGFGATVNGAASNARWLQEESCTFTPTGSTYNCNYYKQYTLTVTGGNYISYSVPSESSDSFWNAGDSLTVSSNGIWGRSGGTGQRVASWNIDGGTSTVVWTTGTVTTSSITITSAQTVAFNGVTQYQLTLTSSPPGGGTAAYVTSPTISGDTGWYDTGTSVTFSAAAATDYGFSTWQGIGSCSDSSSNNPDTIIMSCAVTETAVFVITTVHQPIVLTISPSGAPTATFIISGCNASPSTIVGDGSSHTIALSPSCTFTITITNSGNTRYGFSISGSFSNTSPNEVSCASGTCSTISLTYYYQVSEQFAYSISGGGSPTAPTLICTQLGSSTPCATLTTTLTAYWLDFNTAWSLTNPLGGSSGTERWQANSGVSGTSSAGGSQTTAYYHQFSVSFAYTTNDGTKLADQVNLAAYTQFGSILDLSTNGAGALSLSSDWADAATSVTYVSPVSISGAERYQISSSDSGTNTVISSVSGSSNSAEPEFFHQFSVTVEYTVTDGGSTYSDPTVAFTQFGTPTFDTAKQSSPPSDWIDATTAVSYTNPLSGSTLTERWDTTTASLTVSSPYTFNPIYYHQFRITYEYSVVGGGSPTVTNIVGYIQFGGSLWLTPATDTSVSAWADSGSTSNYATPIPGNTYERWNTATPSFAASSSTIDDPSYYHQYQNSFKYTLTGGGSPTPPTLSCNEQGSPTTLTLTTSNQAFWCDNGSTASATDPTSGSTGSERWSDNGQSFTISAGGVSDSFNFYHQYLATLSYSVSGGGSPTAPTLNSTQFGSSYTQPITTSATGYWLDSSASWSLTNPLGGSGPPERWEANSGASGTVGASFTQATTYYHQYLTTLQYAVSGGGSTYSDPTVAFTQFGTPSSDTARQSSPPSDWIDAKSTVSYTNPLSGSSSSERWDTATSSFPASSSTLNPTYYHQYLVTYEYNVIGGGSPTVSNIVSYAQFGASFTLTPSTDTSASAWTDSGTTSTYATPIAGASNEQWNTATPSFTTSGPTTENPEYYHQYQNGFTYSVTGGGSPMAPTLTCNEQGSAATLTLTTSNQAFWCDSGSAASATDPTSGSTTSERWSDNGQSFVISSGGSTDVLAYYHQYLVTLSYAVSGGGSPTAPTLTSTSFGSSYTPSITTSATGYWLDNGASWSLTNPLVGSGSTERWDASAGTSGTVSAAFTQATTYFHQYSLTVNGGNGITYSVPSETRDNFWDAGSSLTVSSDGIWNRIGGTGQRVSSWNLNGGSNNSVATTGTVTTSLITMSAAQTVNFNDVTQYQLIFNGAAMSSLVSCTAPTIAGDNYWYDSGTMNVSCTLNGVYGRSGGTGTRVTSYSWDGSANTNEATTGTFTTSSQSMSTTHELNANTVTQYQVSLDSGATSALNSITNPTISGDNYWYDSGTLVTLTLDGVYGRFSGTGTRLTGYEINGGPNNPVTTTGVVTVLATFSISSAQSITTSTATQYFLTVNGGNGIIYSGAPPISGDTGWYDSGTSLTVSSNGIWGRSGGVGQRVASWNIDGDANTNVATIGQVTTSLMTMSTAHTVNFNDATQYQLTLASSPVIGGTTSYVTSPTISGDTRWYDSGASVTFSATAAADYSFSRWQGTGSCSDSSTTNPDTITLTCAATQTAAFRAIGTTVATVYQPIVLTIDPLGAPTTTFTISGCSASPSTIVGDGSSHTIALSPSCTFTITITNSGNTRYGFSISGSFSNTSPRETSCASVTCSVVSLKYYYQLQNTFRINANAQADFDGGLSSVAVSGTQLGSAATLCTIMVTVAPSDSCSNVWSDFNGIATVPSTMGGAPTSSQWLAASSSSGAITTGGSTVDFQYYKQWINGFKYTTSVSSPTAPALSCSSLGSPATVTLTTSYQGFYCDNGSTATATNPITGSTTNQRWSDDAETITIDAGGANDTFIYFHQYAVTYSYTIALGGSPIVTDIVTYTQFGSTLSLTPTVEGVAAWTDAGTASTYTNPVGGGPGERWQTATTSVPISSPITLNPTYSHQYYLIVSVASSASGITLSPASGWYDAATALVLNATASPSTYLAFDSWTGTGPASYTGPNPETLITLNSPTSETANFSPEMGTLTFVESGLPAGTEFWVTANGVNKTTTGDSISFTEVAVGSMVNWVVQTAASAPHTGSTQVLSSGTTTVTVTFTSATSTFTTTSIATTTTTSSGTITITVTTVTTLKGPSSAGYSVSLLVLLVILVAGLAVLLARMARRGERRRPIAS